MLFWSQMCTNLRRSQRDRKGLGTNVDLLTPVVFISQVLWRAQFSHLMQRVHCLMGDVVLACLTSVYYPCFANALRGPLVTALTQCLVSHGLPCSKHFSLASMTVTIEQVRLHRGCSARWIVCLLQLLSFHVSPRAVITVLV